ncbi:MAG: acyl-CoA dehydratase activase [Verrucomicrobiae bacterium]
MITAGIDAGSRTIKAVLWDSEKSAVVNSGAIDQGVEQRRLAGELVERLLSELGAGRPPIARTVATGYGRNLIDFADARITEITCHAAGVALVAPSTRTIIEIGGQDNKVIRLDESGTVCDFDMNDRCAAGTGRFLEVVATRLGVQLDELGLLVQQSRCPTPISSMCAVFAETEIVGLLAGGRHPADIVAGVQAAISLRVSSMAGRNVVCPICFTGGVALVPGMAKALQSALGHPVAVAPHPLLTGALGAALLALEI